MRQRPGTQREVHGAAVSASPGRFVLFFFEMQNLTELDSAVFQDFHVILRYSKFAEGSPENRG